MDIRKSGKGDTLALALAGRLDSSTAPELEAQIAAVPEQVSELVLDFAELDYVSSAGLRVILMAQKKMNKQGEMRIINVNESVMEVFSMTGFTDILRIE